MPKGRSGKTYIFALVAIFSSLVIYHAQAAVFDAQTVVDLINKDRSDRQIQPLNINNKLSEAAKEKAYDMFAHGYFAHNSPQGVTPWQWIENSGYDYAYAGENLAINFTDAQAQHAALMASQSHRDNIVNAKYHDIGVAVVEGSMGGRRTILTVQEFGASVGAATASNPAPSVEGAQVVAGAAQTGTQKITRFVEGMVGSVSQGTDAGLQSRVGGVYTYSMLVAMLLIFCAFVFLFGHAHRLAHQCSLHARSEKIFSTIDEDDPRSVSENGVDSIHLGKLYLTHMKMRK